MNDVHDALVSPRLVEAAFWRVRVPGLPEWMSSPEFGAHQNAADAGRTLLRLTDDQGHVGWGEAAKNPSDAELEAIAGLLLGKPLASLRPSMLDLHPPGKLYWHRPAAPSPYAANVPNLTHRLRHGLQTLVEMALADLTARRAGLALHMLFGGACRDRVSVDYWMGRTTPEHARQCVQRGKALGFTGIKLKTTLEDPNVERLEAILEAGGAGWHVTVDPNGRFYRLDDAWPTIRRMDAVGNMSILEDPFPRFHLDEFAALRPRLDARLVVHIDPPESLGTVLKSNAAGGLNIDSHAQGLWMWRQSAAAAEVMNLPVWHGSGLDLGIYTAAQLHIAAATPNCTLPGDQVGPWLRESHLLTRDFIVENGHVLVPQGPGLGVEVDFAALDRYTHGQLSWKA